jgi:DNA invertase Pin-like site-specific DNA recombinase
MGNLSNQKLRARIRDRGYGAVHLLQSDSWQPVWRERTRWIRGDVKATRDAAYKMAAERFRAAIGLCRQCGRRSVFRAGYCAECWDAHLAQTNAGRAKHPQRASWKRSGRLTPEERAELRRLSTEGASVAELAERYGINHSSVTGALQDRRGTRLSSSDRQAIERRYFAGESPTALAREYRVSMQRVWQIGRAARQYGTAKPAPPKPAEPPRKLIEGKASPGRHVGPHYRNFHSRSSTVRCIRLLAALMQAHPRGLTWREIADLSGCGRETIYRDFAILEAAGVRLERVGNPGSVYTYRVPRRIELGPATVDLVPSIRRGNRGAASQQSP